MKERLKTKLEIKLFCDKAILLQKNKKLKLHIEVLNEVLKKIKPK